MINPTATTETLDGLATLASSTDYEAIRTGLTSVIALLEQPGLGLNDSVRAYEVGRLLSDRCQVLLDEAELRIVHLDTES